MLKNFFNRHARGLFLTTTIAANVPCSLGYGAGAAMLTNNPLLGAGVGLVAFGAGLSNIARMADHFFPS